MTRGVVSSLKADLLDGTLSFSSGSTSGGLPGIDGDGDGWALTEAGRCVEVGHGGPARLSVCHSAEANLLDQDATGRGLRSGQTLNGDCVDHEVEIEAGAEVVLTLTN